VCYATINCSHWTSQNPISPTTSNSTEMEIKLPAQCLLWNSKLWEQAQMFIGKLSISVSYMYLKNTWKESKRDGAQRQWQPSLFISTLVTYWPQRFLHLKQAVLELFECSPMEKADDKGGKKEKKDGMWFYSCQECSGKKFTEDCGEILGQCHKCYQRSGLWSNRLFSPVFGKKDL